MLGQGSNLNEVLWNFSRFKDERRLTLKHNPHFYSSLPTSQKAYGGDFSVDPIENFQHDKICVLTDKPGRVFLETDKNRRAIGNFWVPDKAIIFKGLSITFSLHCFLTAFLQTSVESLRANVSFKNPFKKHLIYHGISVTLHYRQRLSLSLQVPAVRQLQSILQHTVRFRTGENRFAKG